MSNQETKVEKKESTQDDCDQIIDLTAFLSRKEKKESTDKEKEESWIADCKDVARRLHQYGIIIIRDPRVKEEDNDTFIDLMEQYYDQPDSDKAQDIRKDVHYQVGYTPQFVEKARDHCEKAGKMEEGDRPATICPPGKDPKVRFFWRMGETPTKTEFKRLNAEPVLPKNFPSWPKIMNNWGGLILNAVHTVAEMAAVGFGMKEDTFTSLMQQAPHLLAPTGSDLDKFGKLGTVFASFHYDLNFLTIHGRSRFPGLFVWTRDGKRRAVKVPAGCLLLQAGKQFEWLTGGYVLAGFHEVVVTENTLAAVELAKKNKKSLNRVSSTLFSHIASDNVLEPLGHFSSEEALKNYPPTKAGVQVQNELNAIKLGEDDAAPMA